MRDLTKINLCQHSLTSIMLFCMVAITAHAQTTISGTVNSYTAVLGVDGCGQAVAVENAHGFAEGDLTLLIQMKGASIDLDDDNTFGDVTDENNAGKYEFAVIDHIEGNTFTFVDAFENSYDPGGAIQLVRVPEYTNVTVNGTLTGCAWNGSAGGVIAVSASGTVTLAANIDAKGIGFRGGEPSPDYPGGSATGYRYALETGLGGMKGEGIAASTPDYEAGRGKLASGGGGGNAHNAGGGGGGNYGAGGTGGKEYGGTSGGGIGGKALNAFYSNTEQRIFMGGGGGGGHQNGSRGHAGAAGGGIIIIRAATITVSGAARTIDASGDEGVVRDPNDNDGSGGGGGGGCVLLDVTVYQHATNSALDPILTVKADGGTGGGSGGSACHGPGGGGGGGSVWFNQTSSASTALDKVDHSVAGGAGGTGTGCTGSAGSNGTDLYSLDMPE